MTRTLDVFLGVLPQIVCPEGGIRSTIVHCAKYRIMEEYHLMVLVHGLWGNKSHFDYICQQIERKEEQIEGESSEKLVVYRAHDNEGYRTLDGIDVCGLRVAQEVRTKINHLNTEEGKVTKISIIGYSLGGLICRYAIGILYHQGLFEEVEPLNFTTFCTPHVGVLTPGSNISVRVFNQLVPSLLSLSGRQMFLKDQPTPDRALLSVMANPNSVFFRGLSVFKYRQLYANAINDKRTAWWTSGISIVDPFIKINENSSLDDLEFRYVKSYEPIVLDSTSKFIISNKHISSKKIPDPSDELVAKSDFFKRKLKWLTFALNVLIFAPLWVVWFICSNLVESMKSYKRIKDSLSENAVFLTKMADISEMNEFDKIPTPLIPANDTDEEERNDDYSDVESIKSAMDIFDDTTHIENKLQDRADDLMESLWGAMTSKSATESAEIEHYKIKALEDRNSSEDRTFIQDPSTQEIPSISASIQDLSFFSKESSEAQSEVLKPFILDLTDDQIEIIKSLNQLHWEKYPILIRHTTSTHSAAIVRNIDEKALFEGKTVINHWLNNVFKTN